MIEIKKLKIHPLSILELHRYIVRELIVSFTGLKIERVMPESNARRL
ncbi:MAG: hypothetical protein JXR91_08870 [Deltaproteobacteria bacterium]|jgi:hypothetical protein|nr:hypothetical protein [Deltaproteobacteria bacterium]